MTSLVEARRQCGHQIWSSDGDHARHAAGRWTRPVTAKSWPVGQRTVARGSIEREHLSVARRSTESQFPSAASRRVRRTTRRSARCAATRSASSVISAVDGSNESAARISSPPTASPSASTARCSTSTTTYPPTRPTSALAKASPCLSRSPSGNANRRSRHALAQPPLAAGAPSLSCSQHSPRRSTPPAPRTSTRLRSDRTQAVASGGCAVVAATNGAAHPTNECTSADARPAHVDVPSTHWPPASISGTPARLARSRASGQTSSLDGIPPATVTSRPRTSPRAPNAKSGGCAAPTAVITNGKPSSDNAPGAASDARPAALPEPAEIERSPPLTNLSPRSTQSYSTNGTRIATATSTRTNSSPAQSNASGGSANTAPTSGRHHRSPANAAAAAGVRHARRG